MRNRTYKKTPVRLKPTVSALSKLVRDRAANKDNVLFSDHAFDRQKERSDIVVITQEDVYRVLQLGSIEGQIHAGIKEGEWKATVTFRPKGGRKIGVATVILSNCGKLLVTTVMWRDT